MEDSSLCTPFKFEKLLSDFFGDHNFTRCAILAAGDYYIHSVA